MAGGTNTVARLLTADLPQIRPCFGPCGRMTRTSVQFKDDYPDTIRRNNAYYCTVCFRKYGHAVPDVLVPKLRELQASRADMSEKVQAKLDEREVPVIEDESLRHITAGLNRFMAGRQQRERRRRSLAQVGNVATPHQPQPRGNRGSRVAAEAHRPRPVAGHQQVAGTARVHAESA
jgi:hypothetical protein